jgi:polar amino acid transport system substrate-binding protein
MTLRRLVLLIACVCVWGVTGSGLVFAQDVRVMTSGALAAPLEELVPQIEKVIGRKVTIIYGSSQGGATDSIPERLKRSERAHVVLLGRDSLDALVMSKLIAAEGVRDIVRSRIGMSVRLGLPKPDISMVEGLKKALVDANSIAYSASVSGTYLSTVVFQQLGVAETVLPKSKRILSERIGAVLARGEADIGFQQISELLPFASQTQFVGPLPEGVQKASVFAAGLPTGAPEPEVGLSVIAAMASADVHPILRKHALEPISADAAAQALAMAFAPLGTLRALINTGNPVLARLDASGAPVGVSVDLAHTLAARLGVALTPVVVTSAGSAVEAMRAGKADIGFFAIDPARSAGIEFSPPYVVIEGAYAVRPASPLQTLADVDKAGTRVVVGRNSAYDLFLTREIKAATLVRAPTSAEVVPLFLEQNLEVAAGVRQQLDAEMARRPGVLRLLPGSFMTINQAVGLAAGRAPAARETLKAFVEEMKATGAIADALRRHNIEGATVAPQAP